MSGSSSLPDLLRALMLASLLTAGPAAAVEVSLVSVSDDPVNVDGQGGSSPDMDAAGDSVVFVSASTEIDDELWELAYGSNPTHFWVAAVDQIYVRDLGTGRQSLITRDISYGGFGLGGDRDSWEPSIDPSGRFVAYVSAATNLASNGAGILAEVIRFDRHTGQAIQLSLPGTNARPDAAINGAVAFDRSSDWLVHNDTNGIDDVYVYTASGIVQRASAPDPLLSVFNPSGPSRNASISGDGRFVVFESSSAQFTTADTNQARDVFLYAVGPRTLSRLSDAPGVDQNGADSFDADISYDGRYVVFASEATNLIPGDVWTGAPQLFLRDRQTGETTRITAELHALGGDDPVRPVISSDGAYVVFEADAGPAFRMLVRYDREHGTLNRVQVMGTGSPASSASTYAISNDGQQVVFDNPVALSLPLPAQNPPEVYRATLQPGVLAFSLAGTVENENAGRVRLQVLRSGGSDGTVSAIAKLERAAAPAVAAPAWDFVSTNAAVAGIPLIWEDRDTGVREITVNILNDRRDEADETFRWRLSDPRGGASIGPNDLTEITIIDDD
jgi:Tol biopolymer transport system component